jgi:hypothetical protein
LVLDLKNAFFTIPLHPSFMWTDPITHRTQQLTWTVLPQGLDTAPHFLARLYSRISIPSIFPQATHSICG